jgi:hypothetical protein
MLRRPTRTPATGSSSRGSACIGHTGHLSEAKFNSLLTKASREIGVATGSIISLERI